MKSKMDNRIIVIHYSEIIRKGLFSIIKDIFKIEPLLLPTIDELKNFNEIQNGRLIVLVDSELDQNQLFQTIRPFQKGNKIQILLIETSQYESDNKADCLPLNASKAKIFDLINPYLQHNNGTLEMKNSSALTAREIDVLKLVAFGKTNKEIADDLFISIHTVISHRKNITEKLGIKSISGLTVYAILNNLIDTSTIDPESLI